MLFAVGDIHGHFDKLIALLEQCLVFAESHAATAEFVLLGDYVDRGPQSRQVVEFLLDRPAGILALRGNHEELLIAAAADADRAEVWFRNGGIATLDSYGLLDPSLIPAEHVDFLAGLPVFHDDGVRLFVHAGIDAADVEARDPRVLLWTRQHPPDHAILPRFLVHGHTPTADRRPDLRANRLNLDTGAGLGFDLTAAAFGPAPRPLAFLTHRGEITVPH
jgi:serine/threonine protein phosphatase 1